MEPCPIQNRIQTYVVFDSTVHLKQLSSGRAEVIHPVQTVPITIDLRKFDFIPADVEGLILSPIGSLYFNKQFFFLRNAILINAE